MCGIAGVASINPVLKRRWLAVGRDTMSHRGPDDSGEWWSEDGKVGMAHRRLSILDLSAAGHQPMHMRDKSLSIIFNGEIYNFKDLRNELLGKGYIFHSSSDTEVILAAYSEWGFDCLTRLNGMFAFAIYDGIKNRVFLARDRAGEKPLFYHHNNRSLIYASELKALLVNPASPRTIDLESLDCYLAMGFVPKDRCILKGYHKLPAAHALVYDLVKDTLDVWCYWVPPKINFENKCRSAHADELSEELETLFEDAVDRQLVADVPVGILLSGGVDSSLVTAMAVRRSQKVRTFTIGFPGYGSLDETGHARLIAKYFGTEHTELMAEPDAIEMIPILAKQFDEPMADSSMIPTWLVSKLVKQHCKVALGGDGGDELFGGYAHYGQMLSNQKYIGFLPYPLRNKLAEIAERSLPVGFKGRNWIQKFGVDLRDDLPWHPYFFDSTTRRKLIGRHHDYKTVAEDVRRKSIPNEKDLIQRSTRMDFTNYLVEDILVKVDRTSMLNSLEIRAPFLDYRIIEFAFREVPANLKTLGNNKKILLKRMADRLLPKEFDRQRKQGFSIPLSMWLEKSSLFSNFTDVLVSSESVFDQSTINDLLNGQKRGYSNSERLFSLVLFELWRREYNVSF